MWDVVYEQAIRPDGSLFFPERLTKDFLYSARKTMGSILFANQYQNEVLPAEFAPFKPEWLRYHEPRDVPVNNAVTFITIDPAISMEAGSDFTGTAVITTDCSKHWWFKYASRQRLTPTQVVNRIFDLNAEFKPAAIGVESVAYQKALLYMLDEEMRRRGIILPVTPIVPSNKKTKEIRIMSLVPRFEWGRISLAKGLHDFESEYMMFPRASHDDIIDSLSHMEELVWYPDLPRENEDAPNPHDPRYEAWYRRKLAAERGG